MYVVHYYYGVFYLDAGTSENYKVKTDKSKITIKLLIKGSSITFYV